mgnify:CR=1 FL=1
MQETDSVLGDPSAVEQFVLNACQRFGVSWKKKTDARTKADFYLLSSLDHLPEPVRAALPAEHHCATGIFGPLTTRREERFEGYYRSAEATFEDLCVRRRAYGTEDWGDFFGANGYVRGTGKLWTNMEWEFIEAPDYTGDIKIGFLQGAQTWWAAIAVSHLRNGLHGVEYYADGAWASGVMNGDMGQSYIIKPVSYTHLTLPTIYSV